MSTTINDNSMAVLCKVLMEAIKVNPDARPMVHALIETLMDNHVPQEAWGTIFFRVWKQSADEPSEERGTHQT